MKVQIQNFFDKIFIIRNSKHFWQKCKHLAVTAEFLLYKQQLIYKTHSEYCCCLITNFICKVPDIQINFCLEEIISHWNMFNESPLITYLVCMIDHIMYSYFTSNNSTFFLSIFLVSTIFLRRHQWLYTIYVSLGTVNELFPLRGNKFQAKNIFYVWGFSRLIYVFI